MTVEEQHFVHRAAGLFDRSYRGVLDLSGKDVALKATQHVQE